MNAFCGIHCFLGRLGKAYLEFWLCIQLRSQHSAPGFDPNAPLLLETTKNWENNCSNYFLHLSLQRKLNIDILKL